MARIILSFRPAPRRFPALRAGRVWLLAAFLAAFTAACARAAQPSDTLTSSQCPPSSVRLPTSEQFARYLDNSTIPTSLIGGSASKRHTPRLSEILLRGQYPDGEMPVYYVPNQEDAIPATADTPPLISGGGYTGEYTATDSWGEPRSDYRYGGGSEYGDSSAYTLQLLPEGILYPSYLAGRKEPRMQSLFNYDDNYGWIWDISLGGRVPLLRYGTSDPVHPEGLQIDMEGAALLRLDFEREEELAATDYRAGLPITYGQGQWQFKTGYYHVSSHLGDQYLLDNFRPKKHYVRDELLLGIAFRPIEDIRVYGEAGWAFHFGETTKPWEFQMGAEYSPVFNEEYKMRGTPFAAVHGHLFQELDYGGYLNIQAGWQWRNRRNGCFRLGAEFYNGCDDQYQFHYMHQRKYGIGFWYDF